jgi:ferredoxin
VNDAAFYAAAPTSDACLGLLRPPSAREFLIETLNLAVERQLGRLNDILLEPADYRRPIVAYVDRALAYRAALEPTWAAASVTMTHVMYHRCRPQYVCKHGPWRATADGNHRCVACGLLADAERCPSTATGFCRARVPADVGDPNVCVGCGRPLRTFPPSRFMGFPVNIG